MVALQGGAVVHEEVGVAHLDRLEFGLLLVLRADLALHERIR